MLLYYNILNVHINTKYIFYLVLVALFVLVRQPTKYKGTQNQHPIKALTVIQVHVLLSHYYMTFKYKIFVSYKCSCSQQTQS